MTQLLIKYVKLKFYNSFIFFGMYGQQLQQSFLGTEENLNNYHLPTQNFHAVVS